MTSFELFGGAGGMALGVRAAGFQTVGIIERDRAAVETLRLNSRLGTGVTPQLPVSPEDVSDFDYAKVETPITLLSGGSACQPFSLAGKHRGDEDPRNLFPEVFRAQRELQPQALLLENVRGLARKNFRPYLDYILRRLALPGLSLRDNRQWKEHYAELLRAEELQSFGELPTYDVWIAAVDCANYGVPQRRHRLFIVAIRHDLTAEWSWPATTHSAAMLEYEQFVSGSYWTTYGLRRPPYSDMRPVLGVTERNGHARWTTVRDVLGTLPQPSYGRKQSVHPNHLAIAGARSYPPGHTGSRLDEPAKTLKAGVNGVPGGENMVRHPNGRVRYFTLHEAALLQSFPAEYVFAGTRTQVTRQIGNAAPPQVTQIMAGRIRQALDAAPGDGNADEFPHIDTVRDNNPITQL